MTCRHFRLISPVAILLVVLVLHGSAILSSGLSGAGLLAFAKHLRTSSQETNAPTLLQAERLLQQAVLWNPASGTANWGLGFVLAARGQEDEAIAVWQAADGAIAEEFFQRGKLAHGMKRYEEALAWYQRAATVEPEFGDPCYYAGLAYERLERWEEALRAYEQAVKVGTFTDVGQSSPYYRLAILCHQRLVPPQLDKALAAYDAAIALDDFNSDLEAANSHYGRGAIYDWQGRDPRDSIREYQQAIALNPRHHWAHLSLGHALYRAFKDVSFAEREIEQALSLWPNNESQKWPHRVLGDIYRDAGMIEKAIAAYREALRLDANDEYVKKTLSELVAKYEGADEQE